jgi:TPR repeat protein
VTGTTPPLPQTKPLASTEAISPPVIQAAAAEVVSAPVEIALPAAPFAKDVARSAPPATLQSAVPSQATQIAQPTKAPTTWQVDAYLRRARELIGLGDVAAARLMLSRAAEGKDSRALVALAETYDPVVLRNWRVVGMRPDPDKARALYEEASERGSKTASEHLLAMK